MTQATRRPLVTVAVVTLNAAAELPGTLRSIARQTWREKEVLVVDGGSTDGTIAILRDPASGVTRWESGKDRGQSHAINKGLARSSGEWVAWLNSDDVYQPGALQTVVMWLVKDRPHSAAVARKRRREGSRA